MSEMIPPAAGSATSRWISRAACLVALAFLAWLAFYLPVEVETFKHVFRDFHMEVTASTKIALLLSGEGYYVIAGVLGLAAFAAQLRIRSAAAATSVHLLIILIALVGYILFLQAMWDPMMNLLKSMSAAVLT